jgi:hypothetical protein
MRSISPYDFSADTNRLFAGVHYLIHVPGYNESGFTVAECSSSDAAAPEFTDDLGNSLSTAVVKGWITLEQ